MRASSERTRRSPFLGFWHYGVLLTYLSAVVVTLALVRTFVFGVPLV